MAAEGDLDRFAAASMGDRKKLAKLVPALEQLNISCREYDEAVARWEVSFFEEPVVSKNQLIESAIERYDAASTMMTMRLKFLSARRLFPQVEWSIASTEEVIAAHGSRLKDPKTAFPAPEVSKVDLSKTAQGVRGREGWLRMASPSAATNDTAWAHIFWPEGDVRGTVISLHGVLMEQDMWPIADPVTQMVDEGFCVIRPEGPWHGRRCPVGQYGGEAVFAKGILGFIELFEAWVSEAALWINWARGEIGGPAGLSGISLAH